MTPKRYPVLSGKELIKRLRRLGYDQKSQRGSHVKLVRVYAEGRHIIVVPLHKELERGTLQSIIRRLRLHLSQEEIDELIGL